ncbi:MAG TPA: LLM class flavin-dependent oxidoreductase [Streptosporangiaceae bacterium]|nr:LLM class flavin-dependent oxidoreductase [Streptosporangiaceae bacterium]
MSRHDHPARIGLKLSLGAPVSTFRRVWRIADEAGFDHCWAFDHLAMTGADDASIDLFEGWTLLAAMAEATSRVRIGLLVTGMTYRHPALLAKQAVTVDHLSGGRLEFGIGAGWAAVEQQMLGIGSAGHQVGRLSEGLQLIGMLWTGARSDFDGRYFRLSDAVADPKPVQRPGPPIWVGAARPAMLRLAARYADVWNWAGDGLPEAVAAGRELTAACRQIGRDPAAIRWSAQFALDPADPAATIKELREWHQAGFTELVVSCSGSSPEQAAEAAAEHILPVIRTLG